MSKQPVADTPFIYTRMIERYVPLFERPEARLRFLNNTLAQQDARQKRLHLSLRHFGRCQHTTLYLLAVTKPRVTE